MKRLLFAGMLAVFCTPAKAEVLPCWKARLYVLHHGSLEAAKRAARAAGRSETEIDEVVKRCRLK